MLSWQIVHAVNPLAVPQRTKFAEHLVHKIRLARAFSEPWMCARAQAADSYEPQCFFDVYIVPHITHFVDADRIFDADLARGHVDVFGVFCVTEDEAAF